MNEGLISNDAKVNFKDRLLQRKADVLLEIERRENAIKIPFIADNCPEKYVELASRIVALQLRFGELKRSDLSDFDVNKIKDISKQSGKSFREVICMLVENATYVNYDVIDARHILQVLEEFNEIYQKHYARFGSFPYNAFSTEVHEYIKHNKNGLSNTEALRTILEVYAPDFANIEIVENNYEALPKSRVTLTEEDIGVIQTQLYAISSNGNIDAIFSEENEEYFKQLCSRLKISGYTFEQFLGEFTTLSYTKCFKAEIMSAVKTMIMSYRNKYSTTRAITLKDPYLRYKIEAAQDAIGATSTIELLDYLGIENDNLEQGMKSISFEEIREREEKMLKVLASLYPDKMIDDAFSKYDRVYDEVSMIARRLDFPNINDCLKSKGYIRNVKYNKTQSRSIYLSERDLLHYRFLPIGYGVSQNLDMIRDAGVYYVLPIDNLGIYRKLAFEKKDVTQFKHSAPTEAILKIETQPE